MSGKLHVSRKVRARLTGFAVAALLVAVFMLVVRARPLSNVFALVIAVGSPYAPFVALAGLGLSLMAGRKLLAIVAVVVVAAAFVVQLPLHIGRPADAGEYAVVRILSSNLRKGEADPSSFVDLARQNADVITVSELTPGEVERFSQAGIGDDFPYRVLIPASGAGGIGLWSRFALTAVSPRERPRNVAITAARLQIPGVELDPLVASVHIISPLANETDTVDRWQSGIAAMKSVLDDFADVAGPGAVVVAGDFNSTPDMRQFRDLLTNGYRDAAHQTGAGFVPTFPANTSLPPVVAIDHVLTRGATAASLRTETITGSDHLALLTTVHIPTQGA